MHLLHLPRLGQTMQVGAITCWLTDPGTSYEIDAELYEVETEKNVVEIVAKLPGTILRVIAPTGSELPVGALLAVVADPGEDPDESAIEALIAADLAEIAATAQGDDAAAGPLVPAAAPDATTPAFGAADRAIRVIPKARAMATAADLDLATVTGTGAAGSITVADVEAALASGSTSSTVDTSVAERRPLTSVARAMASVLTASWRDVPQFVQQVHIDATQMRIIRSELASHGVRVSFTDILITAVATAAREVPEANAQFTPDAIHIMADVNVTVAVDTDAGLLVPVIAQADQLDVVGVSVRLRELSERARARRLAPADTAGGTITVSNLGAAGIETGIPLVASPQATIVFAGAIIDSAVVVDGAVQIRPLMGLAIGYDHRVLDGATAARFTSALKRRLETGA
ncbi:dihydrolipoamide acetyltransferase family protein [Aeromicrobium sp.]|uniref:dihydrolipoamide acetyltransferase family protein n=1 Tax=Aeromicrobium sp. TaxID=1871063 RepID=UPI00199B50FF|nr:dihydrolipoamide acetyltransferase family protein [Aeromicrobium sp.]MBC7631462.1 2-oxo acid dehydrogenase subunit E2 [Aeromicrobium sp.]